MSERIPRLSRRNFLLSIGAGGAATAAALVAKTGANVPIASTAVDKRARRGYRASAHVSNYYRTTKV